MKADQPNPMRLLMAVPIFFGSILIAPSATGGWSDNFDSYALGQLTPQGGWEGWEGGSDPAEVSDEQAASTPHSVAVSGASDLVHPFTGYNSGLWRLTARQFIPSTSTGLHYFIVLNTYLTGPFNWSSTVEFNLQTGLLHESWEGSGGEDIPIVTDAWVEIQMDINLNTDTVDSYYDGALVASHSWAGGGLLEIQALDLYSLGGVGVVYYDDISLVPRPPTVVLNTNDSGPGSLRQAIAEANSGDIITFTNTLSGQTIILTSGQLYVDRDLTIDASVLPGGVAIDGNGSSRIIEFASGTTNTLAGLTLANGLATQGGAIYINNDAVLTVTDCTLIHNSPGVGIYRGGGGIYNYQGTLTLNRSTIARNLSAPYGSGIYSYNGRIRLNNSTVAFNDGPGIYNAGGILSLNNSTIFGNYGSVGPGGIYSSVSLALTNTIVAENSPVNISGSSFTGTNNLIDVDPMLAPLGDYGGPTQTMPPLPGSPAIDSGLDTGSLLATDQRGFARVVGSAVDIGAVESHSSLLVLNNSDSGTGSLRDAIAGIGFEGGPITFTNTLSGQTILLTSGQLWVDKNLTIDASDLPDGVVIDGNTNSRIFEFASGTTNILAELTLTNGYSTYGGAIYANTNASLTITECTLAGSSATIRGGGIRNRAFLTLSNTTLSGNSAQLGGGIDNSYGTLTIDHSALSGNSAIIEGGGIDNSYGTLTIADSTLSGNFAARGGGIENLYGTTTVSNAILSGNSATDLGGGIDNHDSALTIDTSTLSGNSATNRGGGICNFYGTLTLNSSTLSTNAAGNDGGGIFNYQGTNTLANSTLSGNSAGWGGGICGSASNIKVGNSTLSENLASYGGGIYNDGDGDLTLANTIVAGNTASGDSNIYGVFTGANNLTAGDPMLAPLGHYGGPTQTMPPLPGSPAIDAGMDTGSLPATDQRGFPRVGGSAVDIGAVETQSTIVLNTNDSGPGSLRDTLGAALPGTTITFTNTLSGQTIILTSGQIYVDRNLIIDASPLTGSIVIDGNTNSRIFEFASYTTNLLTGLTLTNGRASGAEYPDNAGGAILMNNDAVLTIADSTLTGSSASGHGGGVYNSSGTLLVTNSVVSLNTASGGGGGIRNEQGEISLHNALFSRNSAVYNGGGIWNHFGTVRIDDSSLSDNSAGYGGAVWNGAGTLLLSNSVVTGNVAANGGGGIRNEGDGVITLHWCSFTNNHAEFNGGAVHNNDGTLTIGNSTLSGNTASGCGGALYVGSQSTLLLENSTVSGNAASYDGGGIHNHSGMTMLSNVTLADNAADRGGGIYSYYGTNTLNNSIVAGNTASIDPNISGLFTGSHNLTNDLPLVAPLGDYGGPTQTMPPLPGSPAIDAGTNIVSLPATDQRGFPRVANSIVDIGAVEFQSSLLVVTNADSGPGSLREAVAGIGTEFEGSTVTFADTLSGQTIILTSGQLYVDRNLTVDASALPGDVAIDGSTSSRIFEFASGTTNTLTGLTLINGLASGTYPDNVGGAIFLSSNAVLTVSNSTVSSNYADYGGGIFDNYGELRLNKSVMTGNEAVYSGAGFYSRGASTVDDSTLSGNTAEYGGGIYNQGGILILSNSTLSSNTAGSRGGGIRNNGGTHTISSSTISGNTAGGRGGGIDNEGGILTISSSTLSSNTTEIGHGGGICNYEGTLTISDSTISGNTADLDGGGIVNYGTLTIISCTLSGNTARYGGGIDSNSYLNSDPDYAKTTIINSTFYDNSAIYDGGGLMNSRGRTELIHCTISGNSIYYGQGGGVMSYYDSVTETLVGNCIIAENADSDVAIYLSMTSNSFTSLGYNLIGQGEALAAFNQPGDQTNGIPLLAPFGRYGGPTQTIPPLPESPAIDAGLSTINTPDNDQRGFARVFNGTVDIGAVECQYTVVTNTNDGGPGSLRQAVAHPIGLDNIMFSSTLSGQTIVLTNGQIFVTNNLTIDASSLPDGIAIDGAGVSRIFEFASGTTNALMGLTLANGLAFNNHGGAILVESGAVLTIANCTLSDNAASYHGGGIYDHGLLTINNSKFLRNSANSGDGGAIYAYYSTNTLNNCTFSGNSADHGGAIYNSYYSATMLNNCTLSGNSAGGGGAVHGFQGALSLSSCTLSGNSASQGGGIVNYNVMLILSNTTLSGNSAVYDGGGIYSYSAGTNIINNATLSGNSAAGQGGGIYNNSGTITLDNSIVARNSAPTDPDFHGSYTGSHNLTNGIPLLAPLGDYGGPTQTMPPLPGSPAIDAGLDTGSLPATDQRGFARVVNGIVDIGAVEFQEVDAALAVNPIALNPECIQGTDVPSDTIEVWNSGQLPLGYTISETNSWLSCSTNSGTSSGETNAITVTYSTAGLPPGMYHGTIAVIAECEAVSPREVTITLTVTRTSSVVLNANNSGSGSLREAIALTSHGGTITFSNSLSGKAIPLTSGQLFVNRGVTIDASALPDGIAIDGSHASRIFEFASGTTNTLIGMSLTNGDVSGGSWPDYTGGAILLNRNALLTVSNSILSGNYASYSGGGIFNYGGTLILSSSTLSSNTAGIGSGGGICNYEGTLTISSSTFLGNSASDGGGIYNNDGTLTISSSTVSSNKASSYGGGIYNNDGTLTISSSTLSTNESGYEGGGIYNSYGTLTLNNSTVSGNSANYYGGGIYNSSGTLKLTNSIVAGNSAPTNVNIYGSFTGSHNLTNGVPLLAPLGDYGGPTQTMPPLPDSPAIDAGFDTGSLPATDQRGFARVVNGTVDIGAVEFEGPFLNHRYSFDTDASDSVGSAHGTLQGSAVISAGQVVMNAATLDHVQLPPGILSGYQAATVEAWASFGLNGNWNRLFDFGNTNSAGEGRNYLFMTPHSGDGDVRIAISDSDSGPSHENTAAFPGNLDNQTNAHIVSVFDPQAGFMGLYLNGCLMAVNTNVTIQLTNVDDHLNYIGRSLYALDSWLDGSVDEFRIYNGVLTPQQIAVNAASGPDSLIAGPGNLESVHLQADPAMLVASTQTARLLGDFQNISNVNLCGFGAEFISDDPGVFTVNAAGLVTAVSAGTATLTGGLDGFQDGLSITVTNPAHPVITLVHRYSFTEAPGSTVEPDLAGGAHGAVLGTAAYNGTGQLLLDGTAGSYVNLPNGIISALSNATFEAWVTHNSTRDWERIFDFGVTLQGEDLSGDGDSYLFLTPRSGDTGVSNAFRFAVSPYNAGGESPVVSGPGPLPLGVEVQVVVSYDETLGVARLYTNGVQVASGPVTIPLRAITDVNNWLGRSQWNDPCFTGSFNEFRIYAGAMDDSQVAASYAAGPDAAIGPVRLAIVNNGDGTITLSWPSPSTGWNLQQNTDLTTTNWTSVTTPPVAVSGENQVLLLPAAAQNFYRLHQP